MIDNFRLLKSNIAFYKYLFESKYTPSIKPGKLKPKTGESRFAFNLFCKLLYEPDLNKAIEELKNLRDK